MMEEEWMNGGMGGWTKGPKRRAEKE